MNTALRRLGKGLLYAYVTYLAISLLLILPAINILAPALVKDSTGRELRSELLLFNPFTLAVEARGVSVLEGDGHEPLAFRRLLADLSLASLWEPGVVLDGIRLDDLDLHILRYANGDFHFADLLAKGEKEEPEASAQEAASDMPAITIRELLVTAHTLAFTDRTRRDTYETVQTDLGIRSTNITTVPGRRGDGRLELTGHGGGSIVWEGVVNLGDGSSTGRLELHDIDLTHLWRYEAENLAFAADSARLDLRFAYAVDWQGAVDLALSDGRFSLRDIDLSAVDPDRYPATYARLGSLTLEPWSLNLLERTAGGGELSIRGLAVAGYDEGDTISLRDIFLPPENEDPPADTDADETAANDQNPDDGWQVTLERFSLDDSAITWRTPYLKPEEMRVTPLQLEAAAISWPAPGPSSFRVDLAINDTTRITSEGEINIASGVGVSSITVDGLEVPWLDPLVQEQLRTDLSRGRFSLAAELALADFAPTGATFAMDLTDFATVLHETGDEAFSLGELAVSGGDVDLDQQRLRIAEVSLARPAGSLHILENGEVNINGVVRELPEGLPEDTPEATQTEAQDGSAAGEGSGNSWRVLLDRVLLTDGRLDFADDSLPLPFKTTVENIEAEVTDIDTASETPLTVTLNGNVDGYAPVVIEGSGTPLGVPPDGQLRFRFRGVDIATMSPYSGTYAGYTIDSGTLSLDLRYALAGQAIDGDNRIVISQMELGEPVSSDLAVEVPLKLGIALLTDAKGVIDLSVPVSGNVDDPQFSIGKIIGRALMNVISKAVTAPFKLLAGLVDSDADLENIDFTAGSTELSVEGDEALRALADALTQRPQLSLRVEGYADPGADGRALREARLGESLVADGLPPASLQARDAAWEAVVAERYAALKVNGGSEAGDDRVTAGQPSDAQGNEGNAPPAVETMWQALVAEVELQPGDLEALGSARAAAAKRDLVTIGGIDAARIAISYDAEGGRSAVHMTLDG